ncbi:thiamine diphosphokinase [Paralimibaculum aggregatum]|uniref:Thiamine diphosphokinase n=1 Tax=Paralimibaculum aggregatum TaxID=3036245 RepID=A0ABQ6LQ99_9RHOB|nr:thiamine diphosphokinase [Limibaculum sp. NKW23]GMG84710.1 thiamine diphosphokinase [Limibaculum sp. NKW23]
MAKRFDEAVCLIGGGPLDAGLLARAERLAPVLVAADRGADRLLELGRRPALVIGDMDSISDLAAWQAGPTEVLHLAEQDTTDFEKCLYATEAPLYLALGFTGGRMDHTLAVFHALLARPGKRVVVLGEGEAMTFLPPGRGLRLAARPGMRVSVFPFAETTGILSEGLEWPVAGLTFAPGRQSGTSNRAVAETVALGVDRGGALLILPEAALGTLLAALAAA